MTVCYVILSKLVYQKTIIKLFKRVLLAPTAPNALASIENDTFALVPMVFSFKIYFLFHHKPRPATRMFARPSFHLILFPLDAIFPVRNGRLYTQSVFRALFRARPLQCLTTWTWGWTGLRASAKTSAIDDRVMTHPVCLWSACFVALLNECL